MQDRAKPIMWKPDPLADAELQLECSKVMHRQAGIRGYSCMPKRSHIQRGSYYAEVNRCVPTGRFYPDQPHIQMHHFVPNVALGTGATPTLAAMNGYKLVGLNDPMMLAIYLEVELHYLKQAVKTFGRLDLALDDLTEIVRSTIVLAEPEPAPAPIQDEDDDL